MRTELTQLQQLTFNFLPSEFSTTTTINEDILDTDATVDLSVLGSVLLKTTSENSFEISSNSACTTAINQDILETDATADLSVLGSVLLKTTSENSFEVSSNSACLFDNSFDNPSEVWNEEMYLCVIYHYMHNIIIYYIVGITILKYVYYFINNLNFSVTQSHVNKYHMKSTIRAYQNMSTMYYYIK